MNSVFTIIDILLAFYCAFCAGKLKAAVDMDKKVFNKTTPKSIYFWMCVNAAMSVYLMISIFGRGITRGMM